MLAQRCTSDIAAALAVACALAGTACAGGSASGGGAAFDTQTLPDLATADAAQTDGGASADSGAAGADAAGGTDTADATVADVAASCKVDELSDIFHKKIKPLVSDGQPTTCNQCHLSGVDLGMFVQKTPCGTMACMIEKGMVDLAEPGKSQVLTWIKKANPMSSFITASVQQAEYDAFLEWITYSAGCHGSDCGVVVDPCGANALPKPAMDKPMIGGCDEAALIASFKAKVWVDRDRCAHCHSPVGKDNAKSGAPAFVHDDKGELGPALMMYDVVGKGLIDVAEPPKSLLLTKPLAPKAGGVKHDGGVKFASKNDKSYVNFLAWIEQFAACK